MSLEMQQARHSGGGRNPAGKIHPRSGTFAPVLYASRMIGFRWIPAPAGMTGMEVVASLTSFLLSDETPVRAS